MSEDSLAPIPTKAVPEKIEEAFEKVEKPNASIIVLTPPQAPAVPFEDVQKMVAAALATEDKVEEIKGKKHHRKSKGKYDKAILGMVAKAFWFTVAAFVIATTLTILNGVDILHVETSILLTMFGIGTLPPLLTFLSSLLDGTRDKKSQKHD